MYKYNPIGQITSSANLSFKNLLLNNMINDQIANETFGKYPLKDIYLIERNEIDNCYYIDLDDDIRCALNKVMLIMFEDMLLFTGLPNIKLSNRDEIVEFLIEGKLIIQLNQSTGSFDEGDVLSLIFYGVELKLKYIFTKSRKLKSIQIIS